MVEFEFRLFSSDNINEETLHQDIVGTIVDRMGPVRKEYVRDIGPGQRARLADPTDSRTAAVSEVRIGRSIDEGNGTMANPKRDFGAILKDTRSRHEKAFLRWTHEDDERLQEMYVGGASVEELMVEFGRTEKGILYRLRKFGLIDDPYRSG